LCISAALKKKPDVDCRACEAGVGRQRCHDCRLVERLRRHGLHWVGVHMNINKEEAKTERICARKPKSILIFQYSDSANFQSIRSSPILFCSKGVLGGPREVQTDEKVC